MHIVTQTDHQSTPIYSDNSANLSDAESEIISQISHLYTGLEHIATYDAMNLTNSGKANIRRAQGELQKLRLKMLDFFKEKHFH